MKARYVCFEGSEGVGKTTQVKLLIDYLQSLNHKVLQTKEPGTPHLPVTLEMRKLMLDQALDSQLTMISREFISQGIRSIHLEKLIKPGMDQYDFIIQDRGMLSAIAYGEACGNDSIFLREMLRNVVLNSGISTHYHNVYDHIIYLKGNVKAGLARAQSAKQEFESGDAMESKGTSFLTEVEENFDHSIKEFIKSTTIIVDGKSIDQVFAEIKAALSL